MENNNGRGIFYGVIGVATLVVAIIGATFAYFSASAANNNAIAIESTRITLALEDESFNYYTDMIPVSTDTTDKYGKYFHLYPGLTKKDATHKGQGTCTDESGNSICGVYEFTITNPSETVSQTVFGSLEIKTNDFPEMAATGESNVHYALFKGSVADVVAKGGFLVRGTGKKVTEAEAGELIVAKKGLESEGVHGQDTDWKNTEQELAPETGQEYTLVIWLEENGALNAEDQGAKFSAAIKFDTSAGGSGVTGVLMAGA